MYCPSCDLVVETGHVRCPECHGSLKSASTSRVPETTSVSPGEWRASGSRVGWVDPSQPNTDEEDDWSTPYSSRKDSKRETAFDSQEWEDWVDDEPADEEGLSPTGTLYLGNKSVTVRESSQPPSQLRLILGFAAMVFVLALGYLAYQSKGAEFTTVQEPALHEARDSADRWLQSAAVSASEGDHELAVSQLKKGLAFLENAQAEEAEIVEAKADLGTALIRIGELEQAHEIFKTIAKDPQSVDQMSGLEKSLREKANRKLGQAEALLRSNSGAARSEAKQALNLYELYGGSREQKAQALEFVARSYLAESNSAAASMALQRSQDLSYSDGRARMLAGLILPGQSQRVQADPVPVSRETRVELELPQQNVPTAKPSHPGGGQVKAPPRPTNEPEVESKSNDSKPASHQNSTPPSSGGHQVLEDSQERYGGKDVLPTYDTRRRRDARPPGY